MYDSTVGRFMQRDPIGFATGESNLYIYVSGTPANAVDPSGKNLIAKNEAAKDRFVRWWRGMGLNIEVHPIPDGRFELRIMGNTTRAIDKALGQNRTDWDTALLWAGREKRGEFNVEMGDDPLWTLTPAPEYPLFPRFFAGTWKVAVCVDMAGSKTGHAWIRYRQGNKEYTIGRTVFAGGFDLNEEVGRFEGSQEKVICREVEMENPKVIFGGGGLLNSCVGYAQNAYPQITGDRFTPNSAANPSDLMSYIRMAQILETKGFWGRKQPNPKGAQTHYRNW